MENKFISWLNGANAILIKGENDFNQLETLMKKNGVEYDLLGRDYWFYLAVAKWDHCSIDYLAFIIEYKELKGVIAVELKTMEQSEEHFGMKPWSMDEVIASLKN